MLRLAGRPSHELGRADPTQVAAWAERIPWARTEAPYWLLVTGASTGLGRASALRLAASYQAKPLIVGRRLDNLRELLEKFMPTTKGKGKGKSKDAKLKDNGYTDRSSEETGSSKG